jgi:hypothetical protein
MPIAYQVCNDGHVITAMADGAVTSQEFIEFEIAHAIDDRVRPPVVELFLVERNALEQITLDDMRRILDRRAEIERKPAPHRCAIVVQYGNSHSWNLAKFYEGMVMLHSPEVVIVFGNEKTARAWLGIE